MPSLKNKTVPTSLDFHPNLPGNTVNVNLGRFIGGGYYVIVRGGDDTALQTEGLSWHDAKHIFNSIQKIDKEDLIWFLGSKNNNGFP